jgi:capsular exopolysaccharide synthesis family protein
LIHPQETRLDQPQQGKGAAGLHGGLVTLRDPDGAASEAYRIVRTNLVYAPAKLPPNVIVVTSANPGEGKTTATANLGVALAQAGKETLIVDGDLRRPSLHELFRTRNPEGLSSVLTGEREPREVWQQPIPGLKLLTAGRLASGPTELLGSRGLAEFLRQARTEFQYVLVDTPHVGQRSDSVLLAANADGVLLVLDPRRTPKRSLRRALHDLGGVGAEVLGLVVNKCEASRDRKLHARPY